MKQRLEAFWEGFMKSASEDPVLKWNEFGGVAPRTPEDAQLAAGVDLRTLPPEVCGASCASCVSYRPLNPELQAGFCTHPEVKQDVTDHMVCNRWTSPGAIRDYEVTDQSMAGPQPPTPEEDAAFGNAMAQPQVDPATGQPIDPAQAQAQPGAEAGAPVEGMPPGQEAQPEPSPKKKPEKKDKKEDKKDSKSGNTINIHVGGSKKTAGVTFAQFLGGI